MGLERRRSPARARSAVCGSVRRCSRLARRHARPATRRPPSLGRPPRRGRRPPFGGPLRPPGARRRHLRDWRPSRPTIWFLALFAGYLTAIAVLDVVSASTLLAVAITVVFFGAVMLVRPPRHWLNWVEYVVMLLVAVLWIADGSAEWVFWLALLCDVGLILLERRVARA